MYLCWLNLSIKASFQGRLQMLIEKIWGQSVKRKESFKKMQCMLTLEELQSCISGRIFRLYHSLFAVCIDVLISCWPYRETWLSIKICFLFVRFFLSEGKKYQRGWCHQSTTAAHNATKGKILTSFGCDTLHGLVWTEVLLP